MGKTWSRNPDEQSFGISLRDRDNEAAPIPSGVEIAEQYSASQVVNLEAEIKVALAKVDKPDLDAPAREEDRLFALQLDIVLRTAQRPGKQGGSYQLALSETDLPKGADLASTITVADRRDPMVPIVRRLSGTIWFNQVNALASAAERLLNRETAKLFGECRWALVAKLRKALSKATADKREASISKAIKDLRESFVWKRVPFSKAKDYIAKKHGEHGPKQSRVRPEVEDRVAAILRDLKARGELK